jgi:hypothetical protein
MIYLISFVFLAVFPLALAWYGVYLAIVALPPGPRRTRIWLSAAIAIIGIFGFGLVQLMSYRADKKKDAAQEAFQADTTKRLDVIIAEPDRAKQITDAQALRNRVTQQSPPSKKPAARNLLPSAPTVPQPPAVDPRIALVAEANDLANKINNVANDYSEQITAIITDCPDLPPSLQHTAQHKSALLQEMREYEMKRYNDLYRDKAIDLRAQMLEMVTDIPLSELTPEGVLRLYRNPTNGLGMKEVARNLQALANKYEQQVKSSAKR